VRVAVLSDDEEKVTTDEERLAFLRAFIAKVRQICFLHLLYMYLLALEIQGVCQPPMLALCTGSNLYQEAEDKAMAAVSAGSSSQGQRAL